MRNLTRKNVSVLLTLLLLVQLFTGFSTAKVFAELPEGNYLTGVQGSDGLYFNGSGTTADFKTAGAAVYSNAKDAAVSTGSCITSAGGLSFDAWRTYHGASSVNYTEIKFYIETAGKYTLSIGKRMAGKWQIYHEPFYLQQPQAYLA